jgi:hypothetical protein
VTTEALFEADGQVIQVGCTHFAIDTRAMLDALRTSG